jgi:hypothetical protein
MLLRNDPHASESGHKRTALRPIADVFRYAKERLSLTLSGHSALQNQGPKANENPPFERAQEQRGQFEIGSGHDSRNPMSRQIE